MMVYQESQVRRESQESFLEQDVRVNLVSLDYLDARVILVMRESLDSQGRRVAQVYQVEEHQDYLEQMVDLEMMACLDAQVAQGQKELMVSQDSLEAKEIR